MKKAVMCIMHSHEGTEALIKQLREAGFPGESISVLFPSRDVPATSQAGLSLLAGAEALAIPGLGPFMATGPILATLSGAVAGVPVFDVMRGLVGMGIPEAEAYRYEDHVKDGRILVSVHTDSLQAQKRAEYIFRAHSAEDVCATIDTSIRRAREHRSEI